MNDTNSIVEDVTLSLWKQGSLTEFRLTGKELEASCSVDIIELTLIRDWISSRIKELQSYFVGQVN